MREWAIESIAIDDRSRREEERRRERIRATRSTYWNWCFFSLLFFVLLLRFVVDVSFFCLLRQQTTSTRNISRSSNYKSNIVIIVSCHWHKHKFRADIIYVVHARTWAENFKQWTEKQSNKKKSIKNINDEMMKKGNQNESKFIVNSSGIAIDLIDW